MAENVTIFLDLDKNIVIDLLGHSNDNPDIKVKLLKAQLAIPIIEPIITKVINKKFADGISINAILEKKIGLFNLTEMVIVTGEGWIDVQLTP